MPRRIRQHYPGALYHVTQRGNHKNRIFFDYTDRVNFCLLLQEGVERFGHRIHAFCLMDNHIHLLIQSGKQPISKALQNIAFRHSKRINKKFNTTGHRFQGRYYAGIIEGDNIALEVLKYIHLNPVKANMVERPEDYFWSSHNYYTNNDSLPWAQKEYCLNLFSTNKNLAQEKYIQFMNTPQEQKMIEKIHSTATEYRIAFDDFERKMEDAFDDSITPKKLELPQVIATVCRYFNVPEEIIDKKYSNHKASHLRGIIGYLLSNQTNHSLSSFARYTGKSVSTLSRSRKNISIEIMSNKELQLHIDAINQLIDKENAKMQH